MIKKLVLTLLVLFIVFAAPVHAQEEAEFDFSRAYQDYVFVLDQYQKDHSEYLLARAQYLQAGTLVAQTKAREETATMLESRDTVVTTYLTAVRMRLLEAEGVSDTTKNGLFDRLDAEISWFKDHKERISSAGSLNDLVKDSEEASARFEETQKIVYEALSAIPTGKVSVLRAQMNLLLNRLKTRTFEIRANGDLDTQIVERWIIETDEKITRSLDKEIEAQSKMALFSATGRDSRVSDLGKNYNDIIALLQESHQFLREASKYMKEIINGLVTI